MLKIILTFASVLAVFYQISAEDSTASEPTCPIYCTAIYAPVCAYDTKKQVNRTFSSSCQLYGANVCPENGCEKNQYVFIKDGACTDTNCAEPQPAPQPIKTRPIIVKPKPYPTPVEPQPVPQPMPTSQPGCVYSSPDVIAYKK